MNLRSRIGNHRVGIDRYLGNLTLGSKARTLRDVVIFDYRILGDLIVRVRKVFSRACGKCQRGSWTTATCDETTKISDNQPRDVCIQSLKVILKERTQTPRSSEAHERRKLRDDGTQPLKSEFQERAQTPRSSERELYNIVQKREGGKRQHKQRHEKATYCSYWRVRSVEASGRKVEERRERCRKLLVVGKEMCGRKREGEGRELFIWVGVQKSRLSQGATVGSDGRVVLLFVVVLRLTQLLVPSPLERCTNRRGFRSYTSRVSSLASCEMSETSTYQVWSGR